MGGKDNYQNLILVRESVHILIHVTSEPTIAKYLSQLTLNKKQLVKLNKLRKEAGNLPISASQAVSYIEWLRQSKGRPTFRSMLEADLWAAIEDANDLGHFFMLMEHMGYEISHGNRLGFRLRGQERFMIPGRKNPLFTKEGIQAAIQGNLEANDISIQTDMAAFQSRMENTLDSLTKRRTILNVQKKRRKTLYSALVDIEALAQVKALYEEVLSGMETEFSQYMEAVAVLDQCGISCERLSAERAELYEQLAQVNQEIRAARKKLALCKEIQDRLPQMKRSINNIESNERIKRGQHRRR